MSRRGSPGLLVVEYALLAGLAVAALLPTVWMLSTSFKPRAEWYQQAIHWIPRQPTLANYAEAFRSYPLPIWFANSILVAAFTLALTVLVDVMAAFAFARLEFKGRGILFSIVIATIMVPTQPTAIPLFQLVKWLNLIDTRVAIIVPQAAEAIGVFLLTQFFKGIPKELTEAARIDGAGMWRILWVIIVPLAGPAITVLAILTLSSSWNNFFWPLIVAQSNHSITLPVGLSSIMSGFNEAGQARDFGLLMAMAVVASLPTIVAFIFLQSRFVQGVTLTGIKG